MELSCIKGSFHNNHDSSKNPADPSNKGTPFHNIVF